jgi:F-type H+-transporting ATPase subunit delta
MPLTETKPDALAQIYATSLFELAEAEGGRDRVEEILGELQSIVELTRADRQFSEFFSSRILSKGDRDASLRRIFEGRASDLTVRFLRVLNEKDRLGHFLPIVAAYDRKVQDAFGRVEVDVFTAEPISPEALESVRTRLNAALGKEIIAHPYTDPSMIGGIRLRFGDQLIDASVAAQLRQIRERLNQRGSAEIRSRAAALLDENLPPTA